MKYSLQGSAVRRDKIVMMDSEVGGDSGVDVGAARDFIYRHGRLLERRIYGHLFEGEGAQSTLSALAAYQNDDGGFAHGLEPDKRAATSQPLDVEIAFETLVAVNATDQRLATRACDWLSIVAAAGTSAAVPVVLPSITDSPRADHWASAEYPPSINPTAAIAGHAHTLGVAHSWVSLATAWCFDEVEAGRLPDEAHGLLALTKLAAAAPDRDRATAVAALIKPALDKARFMNLEAGTDTYGLTPVDFAPAPTSMARSWFDDDTITNHLRQLESEQQPDGGWPISWQPLSESAGYEWRAIRTLLAIRRLVVYRRLPVPAISGTSS